MTDTRSPPLSENLIKSPEPNKKPFPESVTRFRPKATFLRANRVLKYSESRNIYVHKAADKSYKIFWPHLEAIEGTVNMGWRDIKDADLLNMMNHCGSKLTVIGSFKTGDSVELRELRKNDKLLNGLKATVVGWSDEHLKWRVTIDQRQSCFDAFKDLELKTGLIYDEDDYALRDGIAYSFSLQKWCGKEFLAKASKMKNLSAPPVEEPAEAEAESAKRRNSVRRLFRSRPGDPVVLTRLLREIEQAQLRHLRKQRA